MEWFCLPGGGRVELGVGTVLLAKGIENLLNDQAIKSEFMLSCQKIVELKKIFAYGLDKENNLIILFFPSSSKG